MFCVCVAIDALRASSESSCQIHIMSQNNDRIVSELLYFRIICMRIGIRDDTIAIIPKYTRQDSFLCFITGCFKCKKTNSKLNPDF